MRGEAYQDITELLRVDDAQAAEPLAARAQSLSGRPRPRVRNVAARLADRKAALRARRPARRALRANLRMGVPRRAKTLHSARFAPPAETAVVLGERQLPQRLRVSGAPPRVDEGALARREDAILPVAQTARVQRVRARKIDGVASRPASAASLLRIYGNETPGALLASLRRRPWRLARAPRAGGGRRRGGGDH